MIWRNPTTADEGQELLVKSAQLIDADFNEHGISIGTITVMDFPKGFSAICAEWCNYQDHYHTKEVDGGFLVADLPTANATHSNATSDVIAERLRQITGEHWTEAHDDQHTDGSLARAASCYALFSSHTERNRTYHERKGMIPDKWPNSWNAEWWKPTTPRRDLVKAAALIIAEIERLDRAESGVAND